MFFEVTILNSDLKLFNMADELRSSKSGDRVQIRNIVIPFYHSVRGEQNLDLPVVRVEPLCCTYTLLLRKEDDLRDLICILKNGKIRYKLRPSKSDGELAKLKSKALGEALSSGMMVGSEKAMVAISELVESSIVIDLMWTLHFNDNALYSVLVKEIKVRKDY